MPLAEKAAGVAGFMVGGPPGAIAARKGVAAGRYGVKRAKQVNTARKGLAEAKNAKKTHNSPSPKCKPLWNKLRGAVMDSHEYYSAKPTDVIHNERARHMSHDELLEVESKIYDELMACECRQNRCRK